MSISRAKGLIDDDETKEERKRYFINERKWRWISPTFMFNMGVTKGNFCEAMENLRRLL